jgi:hypothetical protein
MTPMRANIVGPPSIATTIRASTAACHSAAMSSAFGYARKPGLSSRERKRALSRRQAGSMLLAEFALLIPNDMAGDENALDFAGAFVDVGIAKR